MTNTEIGDRLRIIRQYRRWTQKQLGKVIHADATKICGLERGYASAHYEDMRQLAAALHFSLDAFGRTGPNGFDLTACLLPWPKEG